MIGTVLGRGLQLEKGYGFIESDGVSYFFHASRIADPWLAFDETLAERRVEFEVLNGDRGEYAANVRAAQ